MTGGGISDGNSKYLSLIHISLRRALERTTQKRGSGLILTDYPEIMREIRESDTLRKLWEKYSREYEYAKDISFDDTCNTIQTIMDAIMV